MIRARALPRFAAAVLALALSACAQQGGMREDAASAGIVSRAFTGCPSPLTAMRKNPLSVFRNDK